MNIIVSAFRGKQHGYCTFDTHEYIKNLRDAGIPELQAEAFARVQKSSLAEVMDSTLSTKHDIDITLSPVKERLVEIAKEILVMKWMLGVTIALNVAILVRLFIK